VYLFSTFREPATEGLYLASSSDGYHWDDLGGPYLKPEVGQQKVMRDPSVAQGPDGTFHLVWTSSWKGDLGFGYASTKDFIHWSAEKFIPVMAFDTSTVNVWPPELFYDMRTRISLLLGSTIPFRFEKGEEEERNNHRLYYTTTKDLNFSDTSYFSIRFSVIDAVIVKRGRKITTCTQRQYASYRISGCRLANRAGPWSKSSEPFTPFKTKGPRWPNRQRLFGLYDSYGDVHMGPQNTDFIHFKMSRRDFAAKGHKHGPFLWWTERLLRD
jgi:hypothetical protein